jgi:DNA-directed RNA polymerase specialized sigma subunit
VLRSIITPLSGEERLLLRMRFPAREEEQPKSVEQISHALGITQKAVYKRITRLMKKCRDNLLQQGVTVHDLLE